MRKQIFLLMAMGIMTICLALSIPARAANEAEVVADT